MKTSISAAKAKSTPQQAPVPAPVKSSRWRRPSHGEMLRRIIPGALADARKVMRVPAANTGEKLQAKMRVSQPHDPQEKEADETAAKIMNMPEPAVASNTSDPTGTSGTGHSLISTARIAAQPAPPAISEVHRESLEREVEQERDSEEEHDDEPKAELSRKTAGTAAEGPPQDEDDDRPEDGAGSALQRRGGAEAVVDDHIEAKIRALRGRGQALPATLKDFYERRFGRDFSQVRIHTDGPSADLAKKVNAKAFAVGPNVVFGKGYFQPGTRDGRELMAHELTHVVQQGRAPIRRAAPAQTGAQNQHAVVTPAAQHVTAPATRGPAIQRRTVEGETVHRQSDVESGPILDRIRKYADTFAGNLPGYRLMTFVIGINPITGQQVQRTPLNFVQAVVAVIPGGNLIFERVQQSKALVPAFNWLVKEFTKLGITWPLVKGLLKIALKRLGDLGILDLLSGIVAKATKILNDVFGPTLRKLVGFVGKVATKIQEFVFRGFLKLVGGREGPVFQFLNPIVNLLGRIFNDPVSFGRNLIGAVKLGFTQFLNNFARHFKNALFGWLFGTFSKAGINVPTSFEPVAIFRFITELFAVTWQDIRAKLVLRLGPKGNTILTAVEKSIEVVQVLITEGPVGLWKQIQEDIGNLKETILTSVLEWVRNTIIVKAITKIASMLNPAGAIVQAVLAIYNTVMFFIERFEQIKALVLGVKEALQNIVVGKIGPAANHVEKTMGRALTLVISFLARLIGLGDIVKPVKDVITKIKKRIDAAIDKIITTVVKQARRLFGKVKAGAQAGVQKSATVVRGLLGRLLRIKSPFKMGTADHTLSVKNNGGQPVLHMSSLNPGPLIPKIQTARSSVAKMRTSEKRTRMSQQLTRMYNLAEGRQKDLVSAANRKTDTPASKKAADTIFQKVKRTIESLGVSIHRFGVDHGLEDLALIHNDAVPPLKKGDEIQTRESSKWSDPKKIESVTDKEVLHSGGKKDLFTQYKKTWRQFVPEEVEGSVDYGSIASDGRRSGIVATLTEKFTKNGSAASSRIRPPGFVKGEFDRGHLLANQLGGSGRDPRNLVTMKKRANEVDMKAAEQVIADVVKKQRKVVKYRVNPIYGSRPRPDQVMIEGKWESGGQFSKSIDNT